MIDPKKRRLAVARILAGDSRPEDEAQKLGISARQIRTYVKAAREAMPTVPTPKTAEKPPSENITPPSTEGERKPNPALDDALKAAGEAGAAGVPPKDVPPTAQEVVDGRLDAQKTCLETIGNIKQTIGSTMVSFRYSPPLLLSDQRVQKLLQLSPLEHGIIVANTTMLYPILMKWMSGPYQLLGGLLMGQFLMMVGLDNLAKNEGWEEKPKAAGPPPAAPSFVTPSKPAPAPTAPAWVPPAEGVKAVDAREGPFGQVKDAPAADPATVAQIILPPVESAA